ARIQKAKSGVPDQFVPDYDSCDLAHSLVPPKGLLQIVHGLIFAIVHRFSNSPLLTLLLALDAVTGLAHRLDHPSVAPYHQPPPKAAQIHQGLEKSFGVEELGFAISAVVMMDRGLANLMPAFCRLLTSSMHIVPLEEASRIRSKLDLRINLKSQSTSLIFILN